MKRTRAKAGEIIKHLENPETLVRKKKKQEGPSQPPIEKPPEATPAKQEVPPQPPIETPPVVNPTPDTDIRTSEDTSVFFNRILKFPSEEEDPSEDMEPSKDEQSELPTPTPEAPENLSAYEINLNSPTSPEFISPPTTTPSSRGSTNGLQSVLSVQLDALTNRIHSMDQTIAGRLCHSDQVILNLTANLDQLRALVNLQEDRSTRVLRELSEIRDDQRRQREELKAVRAELREIRK